jgi:hypothetical protein
MVIAIEVSLHEVTVTGAPFKVTRLLPWDAPKLDPSRRTVSPTAPVVPEIFVITGAGFVGVLMDTLSKVAVASVELF